MSGMGLLRSICREMPDAWEGTIIDMFLEQANDEDLSDVVAEAVRHIKRRRIHTIEYEEVANRSSLASVAWTDRVRAIPIAVGDGTSVPFGRMTEDMHRRRIAMLRTQIGGLQHTIELHELAIESIQKAACECLDDIPIAA